MTESIVVKRLTRNLQYRLTYVKIFESYLESKPGPEITQLLNSLILAQQTAIAPLSSYLRGLDVSTQDVGLNEKLLSHASTREGPKAQLRFIYDGLDRSISWYRTQLMDRQMTADPELRQLLLELGELDAGKFWRTEAIMGMLRIPTKQAAQDWEESPRPEPTEEEVWRPRLLEDVSRPAWGGKRSRRWPRPSSSPGKGGVTDRER